MDPLPVRFTSADLSPLVRQFSTAVSAERAPRLTGIFLRFGYVKMEISEAADNLCKNLHSTVVEGVSLTVLRLNGMETHEDQDTCTGPT